MDHHPLILVIPFVLININPLAKFQVATIIGFLKCTSYKKVNLSLTGSCAYVCRDVQTYIRNKVQMCARPEH